MGLHRLRESENESVSGMAGKDGVEGEKRGGGCGGGVKKGVTKVFADGGFGSLVEEKEGKEGWEFGREEEINGLETGGLTVLRTE